MGSNINGFTNESNLISYLNDKTFNDLNSNMKKFLKFVFPNIQSDDLIKTENGKVGQKPDMEITVGKVTKYVSIKIGSGNSVHQEDIDLFINFLNTLEISEEAKIELLKYHWGDGTFDGTGKIRVSSSEYKSTHEQEINLINSEVNKRNILEKIINRLLFQGKSNSYSSADFIYYGNVESGHYASKEEIINYICTHIFSSNSVHFGPLNYQIWNRCLNFNPNTEKRRNVMQAKWGSLLNDLLAIEEERLENE